MMKIVIVGGGTAGITVAARMRRARPKADVIIIEPAELHYYQPLFTLVGGGLATLGETIRQEAQLIPRGVTWVKDRVAEFRPEESEVVTEGHQVIGYDQLVVAPGLSLAPAEVLGLSDALENDPRVFTNYDPRFVVKGPAAIAQFGAGTALFTTPDSPMKCGGGPQKIMWVVEETLRKTGRRPKASVKLTVPGARIFGIPKYRETLERLQQERNVELLTRRHLIEVRSTTSEAIFEDLDTGKEYIEPYALLHVTPPQRAPQFIRESPLAGPNAQPQPAQQTAAIQSRGLSRGAPGGFVPVDPHTLAHPKYDNVWALGDVADLPTAKTGAAVRKQAPVLIANLIARSEGQALPRTYDGYTSCPLVVGHHRVVLAEFGYDGEVMETFPFDQSQPRFSSWVLKRHLLPPLYWYGMLRGIA